MKKFTALYKKVSIVFILCTMLGTAYAGCTACPVAPGGMYKSPSCPTWCCAVGLSYPVDNEGNGMCRIGTVGCAHGAIGCGAPCGCSS